MAARRPASFFAALVAILALMGPALADPPVNPSDQQLRAAKQARDHDAQVLGQLSAQVASLDGEITRISAEVDAKIAKYNQTTQAAMAASEALDKAEQDLVAAQAATADARLILRKYLLAQYMYPSAPTMSAIFTSTDTSAVLSAMDAQHFASDAQRHEVQLAVEATVKVSNAEAAKRGAQQRAEALQQQADQEKKAVLAEMARVQSAKKELAAKRDAMSQQAAAAAARLEGLTDQRAAYDKWRAAEAARKERERLAAIAAEQARQARLAAQRAAGGGGSTAPVDDGGDAIGGDWTTPISRGQYSISSCFCARWGDFHYGVDFAADMGVPIRSIGYGTVVAAGPAEGFGVWVVVDHHNGAYSVYGHEYNVNVGVGQDVSPGQIIAWVGANGQATGPHLHLEIRLGSWDLGSGALRVDPEVWLARRGVSI